MPNTSLTLEDENKFFQSFYTCIQALGADSKLIKDIVIANSNKLDKIDSKIDNVLAILKSFMEEFKSFKTETRDVEEKLLLMSSKISEIEEELTNKITDKDYDVYTDICRRNYDHWEEFEELTRKFLPVSEILYSKLQQATFNKEGNVDFSPVVIELCRAIENEFLLKIFRRYITDIVSRFSTPDSFDAFYNPDKWSKKKVVIIINKEEKEKSIREITKTLANVIRSTIQYRDYIPRFTLGDMNFILDKLTISEVIDNSVLMKDFKNYISQYFYENELLTNEYMSKIDELVNKYRNPAAHPEFVSLDIAKECKDFLPEQIDFLIDCKK